MDVFVGLTPTLPLNLSLTPQLRPFLHGTLTSVSAEYWILLGKAMLWASGEGEGATETQLKMTLAQSLFNTSSKLYFEASANKKALSFLSSASVL